MSFFSFLFPKSEPKPEPTPTPKREFPTPKTLITKAEEKKIKIVQHKNYNSSKKKKRQKPMATAFINGKRVNIPDSGIYGRDLKKRATGGNTNRRAVINKHLQIINTGIKLVP
jgi:hypothetical protein